MCTYTFILETFVSVCVLRESHLTDECDIHSRAPYSNCEFKIDKDCEIEIMDSRKNKEQPGASLWSKMNASPSNNRSWTTHKSDSQIKFDHFTGVSFSQQPISGAFDSLSVSVRIIAFLCVSLLLCD